MKINFFIGSLIGGGAEHVTCNMANFLVEAGNQVSVLTMSETDSYYLDSRVSKTSLLNKSESGNFLKNLLLRVRRLKRYLKNNDCDVYIVMLPITIIMLLTFKRYTSAPIIASERSSPSRNPKWVQALLKKLAGKASGWVFQTPTVLEWYKPYLGKASTAIIPNAIDKMLPDRIEDIEPEKTIVSVGRLHYAKRFDNLIKAYARIAPSFPDYKLVIFGDGGKRDELEGLIDELSLSDKVQLPGFRTGVNSEIKNASLYVLSSDYEGMPNALIEAMAMGLPCVATDCDGGGARSLIENEKNGLLVPKDDVTAIARAMKRMLLDREFAECCGREARKICERLSPEKIYGKWEDFIIKIVRERR